MDIMLPCKFRLPFFRLSFINNRDKVCFQSTNTKADTQKRTSLFSLSHACMFCGEKKPNKSIHTGQISRNSIL